METTVNTSALSARRWAVIGSTSLAGIVCFVAMLLDPAPSTSGREMVEQYALHFHRQGLHTNVLHYGFALLAPVAYGIIGLVRGRGAWLANVAGLFAILGLSTLPGLVLADYHDVAVTKVAGIDVAMQAIDKTETLPGFLLVLLPALLSSFVALILALAALTRARLVHWAVPVAMLGGLVLMKVVDGIGGFAIFAAVMQLLAWSLYRIPREAWFGTVPAQVAGERPITVRHAARDLQPETATA